jgi:phosphatidylglycerophosphatase A
MRDRLVKTIATLFGIGYLPIMSGTFASLAGLLVYLLIKDDRFFYPAFTVVCIILGFAVCGRAEAQFKRKDPGEVVIDEFCGMLIVFMWIPYNLVNVAFGFVVFRLIDILKPYPLKRIERIGKGAGIMLDDIAAAVFTNVLLHILNYVRGVA